VNVLAGDYPTSYHMEGEGLFLKGKREERWGYQLLQFLANKQSAGENWEAKLLEDQEYPAFLPVQG
jgi:hypothetical protein